MVIFQFVMLVYQRVRPPLSSGISRLATSPGGSHPEAEWDPQGASSRGDRKPWVVWRNFIFCYKWGYIYNYNNNDNNDRRKFRSQTSDNMDR